MEKIEDKLKSCDTLIICTTENQVVNYSIIKWLKSINDNIKVYSIVITGLSGIGEKFDNWKLHNRLANALEKEGITDLKNMIGSENEHGNIEDTLFLKGIINMNKKDIESWKKIQVKLLEKLQKESQKVIWNLTGGQRNLIIPIQNMILSNKSRADDLVVYLDGNNDKFFIYDLVKNNINTKPNTMEIELNKQLELLGLDATEHKGFTEIDYEDSDRETVESITEKIIKDSILRKKLISLNLGNSGEKKEKYKDNIEVLKEEFKEYLEIKEIEYLYKKYNPNLTIGKLFEEIVFYMLLKILKNSEHENYVEGVYLDYHCKIEKQKLDQIDILIAIKSGRLIVLECKSGGMEANDAKGTNFTAYNISGIYGMPILVVPMVEKKDLENDEYKNIVSAIKMAYKNGINIYGLGETVSVELKKVKNNIKINGLKNIFENYLRNKEEK